MIRVLLEERFKASVRRETKETSAYVLTVGPNGTKFQGNRPPPQPARPDGRPGPQFIFVNPDGGKPLAAAEGGGGIFIQLAWRCNGNPCSTIMAANQEMANITNTLAGLVGRPVLDRTGIQEKVSFNLEWPRAAPYVEGQLPPPPSFQDLAKAAEAVGLQLKEESRGQIETLVIDRAEKPSEN